MKKQVLFIGIVIALLIAAVVSYNLFQAPEAATNTAVSPAAVSQELAVADGTIYTIDTTSSEARFIIEEILRNVDTTVVGTTNQVSGQVALNKDNANSAQISEILINARTLATDQGMRNRAISNQILLTNQFEHISFKPTQLVGLPDSVQVGQTYTFQIVGDLTIIGQTKEVTFEAEATLVSESELTGLATTTLKYEEFDVKIPFSQAVQAVSDEVTLELEFSANAG
ncbi:MAG: YceI family protein [Ardenticatenaceae bacterium]|nr:YceI family protein [Ardenticatenaceae bacterium]